MSVPYIASCRLDDAMFMTTCVHSRAFFYSEIEGANRGVVILMQVTSQAAEQSLVSCLNLPEQKWILR